MEYHREFGNMALGREGLLVKVAILNGSTCDGVPGVWLDAVDAREVADELRKLADATEIGLARPWSAPQ